MRNYWIKQHDKKATAQFWYGLALLAKAQSELCQLTAKVVSLIGEK
jgi:hypothetical protein